MNISYYYDQISKLEKDIAELQRQVADETKREYDKHRSIDFVNRSINHTIPSGIIQVKQRQIQCYQSDIIRIQSAKTDLQERIAAKMSELAKKRQELLGEENREREKQRKAQENFKKEQESLQKKLQNDIIRQKEIIQALMKKSTDADLIDKTQEIKKFDFFISHATEDKQSFVRPLAKILISIDCKVWYDEFNLKIGDSLRKKIDEGLKSSRYGIVVLSRDFFKKNWPEYELNGLVAKEMNGIKVILPIWHNVTKDEVLQFSPSLADKLALNTAIYSLEEIAAELKKLIID